MMSINKVLTEKKIKKLKYVKNFLLLLFISGIAIFTLSGCCRDANIMSSSYRATDRLISRINPIFPRDQTVLTASFVNIDNLEESSTLGRTISEYIGSRLSHHGFKVIEMKLRKSIFMKKAAGEFVLSRELKDISVKLQAQAIIVGTYSIGKDVIYVSARVINLEDSTILSSYGYKLPICKDGNTIKMLGYY
ncbi:FlgO family outer membrane protein [Desulfobacterales bacterium HSG16]|nr:FlgO family outer membrane protein [Desulfobacterales bacterium HSG16]